jgi:hypothetical protein
VEKERRDGFKSVELPHRLLLSPTRNFTDNTENMRCEGEVPRDLEHDGRKMLESCRFHDRAECSDVERQQGRREKLPSVSTGRCAQPLI